MLPAIVAADVDGTGGETDVQHDRMLASISSSLTRDGDGESNREGESERGDERMRMSGFETERPAEMERG